MEGLTPPAQGAPDNEPPALGSGAAGNLCPRPPRAAPIGWAPRRPRPAIGPPGADACVGASRRRRHRRRRFSTRARTAAPPTGMEGGSGGSGSGPAPGPDPEGEQRSEGEPLAPDDNSPDRYGGPLRRPSSRTFSAPPPLVSPVAAICLPIDSSAPPRAPSRASMLPAPWPRTHSRKIARSIFSLPDSPYCRPHLPPKDQGTCPTHPSYLTSKGRGSLAPLASRTPPSRPYLRVFSVSPKPAATSVWVPACQCARGCGCILEGKLANMCVLRRLDTRPLRQGLSLSITVSPQSALHGRLCTCKRESPCVAATSTRWRH